MFPECTKWRLARLVPYTQNASGYRPYCHVGNTAEQCRLGLCQDSDPAGDLSHSSTESEVRSLDAGSRMDGIPALDRWDLVIGVLNSPSPKSSSTYKRRLISYIQNTSNFRQYCHVGNTAQQCRLRLFQDFDFAGNLEDPKSTSRGILCIFGS